MRSCVVARDFKLFSMMSHANKGKSCRVILVPASYKIIKSHRLVASSAVGVFTLHDALRHQDRLANDPDFDPKFSQLIDFTHAMTVELNAEDIRRISERQVFWSCARRAILVSDDLGFGFVRMFEMLREEAGEKGIRVFHTLDDALDWIVPDDGLV